MSQAESKPITAKNNQLWKWVSIVFHPLLVPTYGVALLFATDVIILSPSQKIQSAVLCLLFTCLLPATIAIFLLKMGKIKSLEMESTEERIIPYLGACVCNALLLWLYSSLTFPALFATIIVASTLAIFIVWLINFYWKISAHAVGIGGLIGAFLGIQQSSHVGLKTTLIALTLIALLVGYARLKLKAHNTLQVVAGFLLGMLIEFFTVLYF